MRFPAVSRFYFLECSGNGLTEWKAPTGATVQQTHGLLSCCQWVGVPLSAVLGEVGVKSGSRWLLAEGADAAAMTRSIPLEKAMDDCLLVYAQNGERLRPEQGYPLRLLVPGFEGNMNIRWLRRLKLSDVPFHTREETSKYTDSMPDGGVGSLASAKPIKTVASYWPYATTLFDYIRRAMPLTAPQSLTGAETYALSAYVLYLGGIIEADAVLDAASLTAIVMPNRNGFVRSDPRPDVGP